MQPIPYIPFSSLPGFELLGNDKAMAKCPFHAEVRWLLIDLAKRETYCDICGTLEQKFVVGGEII